MLLAFVVAAPAAADTVFRLELSLSDAAEVDAAIAAHGGRRSGGTFGADGWTTTSRGDYIEIDLPPGLDTREGMLAVTVQDFEMSPPFTTHYWGFELVALDPFGAEATRLPPAGRAHQSAGYRGVWDEGTDFVAQSYWNLMDPSCTDWHDCTTEEASGGGGGFVSGADWIRWTHVWAGTGVEVWFEKADRTVARTMDLAATAPGGSFYEDRLILAINVCGGSSQPVCGSWDEAANRGGPLGVTYSDVVLEIYGTLDPDAGDAGDGGDDDPEVVGPDDGGGADADGGTEADFWFDTSFPDDGTSPDVGGEVDGGGEAADVRPDGAVPGEDDAGGCGCRSAGASGRTGWLPTLLLGLFVAGRGRSRRRR
ncbi:MAG: hypothetical protein JXB32_06515 [Deltaproteobacteria bacterium]|nr:hypothetical protein [Deltaproteobacteria bacterium]